MERKQSYPAFFCRAALAIAITAGTSSCATIDNFAHDNSRTTNCVVGGLIGAVAGAAVGAAANGDRGAIIGGIAGATAGCGAALAYKDRVDRIRKVAQEENLNIQVETLRTSGKGATASDEAGIVAQVEDQGMFPVGSAQLTAEGRRQVSKLAEAFQGDGKTAILVVGHTDATGSAAGNQKLSEQRARAVASILADHGISKERVYFQGAGASRPVADNTDPMTRGKNRRVEIVEVNDRSTLVKRVNDERNNPKYLAHGTSTEAPKAPSQAPTRDKPVAKRGETRKSPTPEITSEQSVTKAAVARIDFGGRSASATPWTLGQAVTPKTGGFSLISRAYAAEIPMSSCQADAPRVAGDAISLADGKALQTRETVDYLPGYNNRVWANVVNGHLVTISPVSILRDAATVDRQPFIEVVKDYAKGNRAATTKTNGIANTYEGEDRILYRVFLSGSDTPISCMDVVFSKGNSQAIDGALFYPMSNGDAYTATFVPIRT